MKNAYSRYWLAGIILLFSGIAQAGITLGGTRVIYPQKLKEASIMVKNDADRDIMIQSWLEPDSKNTDQDVPFALTPSLSRLGGNKQQSLRIFYAGKGLPSDKESVFWLSVQEIPQKSEANNTLQIAVRQRIKLFYRPTDLSGTPEESVKFLKWQLLSEGGKRWLLVSNNSVYYASFGAVSLEYKGARHPVNAEMVAPGATGKFLVEGAGAIPANAQIVVEFNAINDYGVPVKNLANISN
ncbi:molecular chaperone [Pseudomonas edaphica]|uniref:Molecular chaperone n=1 Tax=Pseudomonas edaphica TaxID=2006980 RepID=A0ABY2U161_9PSED|nr:MULTISPECIES: molecular chaperone [Pseudomonas]MCK3827496.1 molecular chaperone [Pseudomonas sp. W2Aug9]TDR47983.1 P pilus assembly chaperone PapD [Pseudomonas brenneri]TLG89858.1 molecular chaperone [Pseudomonas edaphica]